MLKNGSFKRVSSINRTSDISSKKFDKVFCFACIFCACISVAILVLIVKVDNNVKSCSKYMNSTNNINSNICNERDDLLFSSKISKDYLISCQTLILFNTLMIIVHIVVYFEDLYKKYGIFVGLLPIFSLADLVIIFLIKFMSCEEVSINNCPDSTSTIVTYDTARWKLVTLCLTLPFMLFYFVGASIIFLKTICKNDNRQTSQVNNII